MDRAVLLTSQARPVHRNFLILKSEFSNHSLKPCPVTVRLRVGLVRSQSHMIRIYYGFSEQM